MKHRLNIELPKEAKARLTRMKKQTGLASRTAVIIRAVEILDYLVGVQSQGWQIMIENKSTLEKQLVHIAP